MVRAQEHHRDPNGLRCSERRPENPVCSGDIIQGTRTKLLWCEIGHTSVKQTRPWCAWASLRSVVARLGNLMRHFISKLK